MEKFVRTAAVPGVSLADILTDPRTLIKDIEKANAQTIRSSKTPTKLKDMLKKKSTVLYNKVCIFRPMCVYWSPIKLYFKSISMVVTHISK